MVNRSAARIALALAFALSAVAGFAGPAAAETVLDACTGTCGAYDIGDSGPPYGANCSYEKASHDLDKMSARPPTVWGNYDFTTTVKWRFKIIRSSPSGQLSSVTGRYQSAQADNMTPARVGNGFSRRTWRAPESPTGRFSMWLEIVWVGSSGVPGGSARVLIDHYKGLWNGNVDYSDDCRQDW